MKNDENMKKDDFINQLENLEVPKRDNLEHKSRLKRMLYKELYEPKTSPILFPIRRLFEVLKLNQKRILVPVLIFILFFTGTLYYLLQTEKAVKPTFAATYRLTNDKISQSAPIVLRLPKGFTQDISSKNITFNPTIKGEFLPSTESSQVIFKPSEKLNINTYYQAELTTPEGIIRSDFLVVEDPEIVAIFPHHGSEAPETSEITIVFNRPMVPLTTLGFLDKKSVPVEITPPTEGRFKWITTSNLQFIPKERLFRSTTYKVSVKPGFVSMEGLEVKGREVEFTTRKLRLLSTTHGNIVYNQPISLYFNQPVDLEKTKKEITVTNKTTNQQVPLVVEYGKRLISDSKRTSGATPKEEIDKTVLLVYNQKDRFGREKYWDFENSYQIILNKAYPTEGNIIGDFTANADLQVSSIIESITAESPHTQYASADYFDPQGKLWINFYEEIDLDKSIISSPKIKEIGYGEKAEEEVLTSITSTTNLTDRKKIYVVFDSSKIGIGEKFELKLEKIVNTSGLVINREPYTRVIKSYPKFNITNTLPQNNSLKANLTQLIICSSTPLIIPKVEEFSSFIKSNLPYEIRWWPESWMATEYLPPSVYGIAINPGDFVTLINIGFMPSSNYQLELQLTDVFGQKTSTKISFTTGEMPGKELSFHHLQNPYSVTTPEFTKLNYAVINMDYLNLEIYKLEPLEFMNYLQKSANQNSFLRPINKFKEKITTKLDLPKRYWIRNFFQIDIKTYFKDPLGHYLLRFSHPDYQVTNNPAMETLLTVTDLGVVEKSVTPEIFSPEKGMPADWMVTSEQLKTLSNLYWVTSLSTQKPIPEAKIELFQEKDGKMLLYATTYSDTQGISPTPSVPGLVGVIVSKDKDSTVLLSNVSKLNWVYSAYSTPRLYLYTDKPIYQANQEVNIKGIFLTGYDGNYEIPKNRIITLKIFNPLGEVIFTQDLSVNEFGTFNTKFLLEKNPPLGWYWISAGDIGYASFEIQEYVPAPFEVSVKSDKEEYISKDIATLDIDSRYYFGVPLEGGEVTYTISSQNYYFDKYTDGYYNFGSGWDYRTPYYNYGDRFLLRGRTSLDVNGKARITQLLDLEKFFKDEIDRKSKIIVFDITVQNSQGQSVSSQKSVILHAGEFYLGIKSDKYFAKVLEKFNLQIKSVDIQGKALKLDDITLNIYKIDWVQGKRQGVGGGFQDFWEKKRSLVKTFNFSTNSEGNYTLEIQLEKEGEYEAEVSSKDKRLNRVFSIYNIYIFGKGSVEVKPTTENQLEIEVEKKSLKVGEEGKILIKSPYSSAKALISLERGKIFEYYIQEIEGNLLPFTFKIKEEYLPSVYVSVVLLSPKPDVKYGYVELQINTEIKQLNIEVKSNKAKYLPGEEAVLTVLTKDYSGKPVSAEVSVAVVDLSVLALKGNPKKDLLQYFYSGFPWNVATASNLKNILVKVDRYYTKGGSGADRQDELAKKKRGEFKETAFWQAVVRTNEQGEGQVKFRLPDNLTTWQVETIGLTKDAKFGVYYLEFMTRKDLMVVPLKPRFVIPGDIFQIGAQIFNQSSDNLNLTVNFESPTLLIYEDKPEKNLNLASGKSDTLYFKVQAPSNIESGQHTFTLSAKGGGLEDTAEFRINITPNNTYEVTVTANYTSARVFKEYIYLTDEVLKDKGSLTVKTSATLAVFLSDALKYLLDFPYGCTEQIASKLKAIAVIKRGLALPNLGEKFNLDKIKYGNKEYTLDEAVEVGLSELYNSQNWDGGFPYWRGGNSDFYLTLHVVETFNSLFEAGYKVNRESFYRAVEFITQKISAEYSSDLSNDKLIMTFYALMRSPYAKTVEHLKPKIVNLTNDDLFLNDKISSTSLAQLALILQLGNFEDTLKSKVYKTLDNRVKIDGRGAFLDIGKNILWEYYETSIKNTSLYLKAQTAAKWENPLLDKILRWLINSRSKDGSWGSTNNTLSVIDALTDYLTWKRETESEFTLEISLNENSLINTTFNKDTVLDQLSREVPIKDLKFNQTNLITFNKQNLNNLPNAYYYDMALKYYLPANQIPPRDEGFSITREFYSLNDKKNESPLLKAKVGEILRVRLQITVPKSRNFVMIEDYIPAGMEIVNLDLATEQKSLLLYEEYQRDPDYWRKNFDRSLYPQYKAIYNDRVFLYVENLSPGVYEFEYFLRVLIKGKFSHLPAMVSEMYFPENFGRTEGRFFEIE